MRVTPGTRIGVYQVTGLIGAGGMGEVYRAEDVRLGRSVALKLLPAAVATDADRLSRFEREARVLAALNHPHIASIYGIEEADKLRALVLELVEGPTLAERLQRGAMPVDEAIAAAWQITDALEAAHEKGIVHRDLKPANIKLTADGAVKVLDFGLAKALDSSDSRSPSESPTVTAAGTRAGVVLGTDAYMSPEQARGLPVDKRTDIWAFGCVLYEMLTGRAAFAGATISDTLARVLEGEPDWARLPAQTPPAIRRLLRRCLEKDHRKRLRDIGDARLELQDALEPTSKQAAAPVAAPRAMAIYGLLTLLIAAAAALGGWFLKPSDARVSRLSHVLAPGETFGALSQPLIAIAPDGGSIVYATNQHLALRVLSGQESAPIRGTEGSPAAPFFAPDGQSVGYWDQATGQLRRIPLEGGTAVPLTQMTALYGAAWERDDTILYGQEDGIWRISANGGAPEQLVRIEATELAYGPRLLPAGDAVLFSLVTRGAMLGQSTAWDTASVVVQSLGTGERRQLVQGSAASLLSTGHLVYARDETLFAVAFDSAKREISGEHVPIVDGVQRAVRGRGGQGGAANYDVSTDGTLLYVPSFFDVFYHPRRILAVDNHGKSTVVIDEQRDYWRPKISPDGTRIAIEVLSRQAPVQIWMLDVKSGTATPLAGRGENAYAAWYDRDSIVYRGTRGRSYGIYRQAADGSTEAQLLFESPDDMAVHDVSRDGVIVFTTGPPQTDIRTFHPKDEAPSDFVTTNAREHMPSFSPDGRWLAYTSNQSGQDEVYVRAFPRTSDVERLVSVGGGNGPAWAPDGTTLYYRGASGEMMAVPTTLGATFSARRPRALFRFDGVYRMSGTARAYDVHPDGKRFIMVSEPELDRASRSRQQVNVVLNWFQELERLAPSR